MADHDPVDLSVLDDLDADELRRLVRLYDATLRAVIAENSAFSQAQENGNQIWSGRVNAQLAALFEAIRADDQTRQ